MELGVKLTRKRVGLVAAVSALVTATGIGYAAIPDADGNIYACMRNTGTIRLIDKSLPTTSPLATCTSSETEVSWSKGAKGDTGAQGPPGPVGPAGPTGPQGPRGVSLLEVVSDSSARDSDTMKNASVTCPGGKLAVGGGASFEGDDSSVFTAPIRMLNSVPHIAGFNGKDFSYGWFSAAAEISPYAGNWSIRVYAICAHTTTEAHDG
jgi:hypothetical protein